MLDFTDNDVSAIRNSHISFMVPCYGGAVFESFFVSFVRNVIGFSGNKLKFSLETISNESLVTRARNNLIAKSMANPEATHFMFIDADISFDVTDVYRLLTANKDVIGGLYPKKNYPIQYVTNTVNGEEQLETGIQEVEDIGTGFMLIKRSCIEKMFTRYHDLKYNNQLNLDERFEPFMYALFDTWLLPNGNYISEDFTFCKRWKDMGGKVYAHNDVKLGHSGYHTFSSSTT